MKTRTVSIWGVVFTLLLVGAVSAQGVQQNDMNAGVSGPFQHLGSAASISPGGATVPQQAWNVEFVGRFGGVTTDVVLSGSYAYVGVGPYLVILDVSNPANPVVVGRTEPLPAVVNNLTVAGGYAYVANRDEGLRIIDVSDPAHPVEVGFYNPGVLIWDVAIAGNYAYTVTKGDDGLRIIDISDPVHPVEVGFFPIPYYACGVAVQGGYAYVANHIWGLQIVNISDPANPVGVGSYSDPEGLNAVEVAVAGDYAYVTGHGSWLYIINISDPANPVRVSKLHTLGGSFDVEVTGEYAYVAHGWGLVIADVSDPFNPTLVGSYSHEISVDSQSVAIRGDYAYLVSWIGLEIINISDPNNLYRVGFYQSPGGAIHIAVAQDYAYIADKMAGLRIVDVSDLANPVEVGSYDTPGSVHSVAVVGDYAYVADGPAGLRIIDVSDPANPVEVGFYDTPEVGAGSVAVVGDYAYVADGGKGLRIIDVSDPTHPVEVGSCNTPLWGAMDVAIRWPYAYVANNLGGLRIINISDPTSPYEVGFYIWCAYQVEVVGDYAFLASGNGGMCIINILNPSDPFKISCRWTGGGTSGVAVAGDYAYATGMPVGSFYIFDISDPYNPGEVGFYDLPGEAVNVAVVDDYAFIADEDGGMSILRYTGGERFTIAGYVQDSNGMPFSNVTIRAGFHQDTTDATGAYIISDLLTGTYTLIPALNGYTFYPPTRTVAVPPDAIGQDFVILPAPVSTVVPPDREATLLLTDTQGLTTTIAFPAGSVTQTTTIVLTPTVVTGGINFAFAGHAFELEALRNGATLPGFTFEIPITVTIYYSNQDVRGISDESRLALMRWTGSGWEDAANTCIPPSGYLRDLENNVLSVAICHLSTYALLGPPNYPVYLPLVMRNR